MKIAIAKLESLSPYSQSRRLSIPRKDNESWEEWEKRVWRERLYVTEEGYVFIGPKCFHLSLATAARFLSRGVPGKGKATFTKHFLSGVLVPAGIVTPTKASDAGFYRGFFNSQGKRGGKLDVEKIYPELASWSGEVEYYVFDPVITEVEFKLHLEFAGQAIGIGRYRPENGGYYGRYKVNKLNWKDV